MSIKTFAEAEQVLAIKLKGYTERPQQQALAAFIEGTIAEGGHALAEAGCGTGKSLASMIPAILSGQRVVVATATKALMEQYANSDVPFLEENLPVNFTWALVKGRSNYLCRAKAIDPDVTSRVYALPQILAEADTDGHSGDFDHFETPIADDERRLLASTANECPGKKQCPFGEVCFAEAAKKKGREAQVVITNTAMLLTDMKVREMTDGFATMLGNYDMVVIDEAHEIEDYATNALSSEIRYSGIQKLVGEAVGFMNQNAGDSEYGQAVMTHLQETWGLLDEGQKTLRFFVEHAEPFMLLIESLRGLAGEVAATSVSDIRGETQRARLVKRATNRAEELVMAITTDDELLVRWVEVSEFKGQKQSTFHMAPVHVGSYLAEWLWDSTSAVLVSATLSVHGDFGFISDRLGLPSTTKSLSVGTPFDYEKQAMLFIPPSSAPSPKDRNAWLGYAGVMTQELVKAAGGGALLLFTSRSAMQEAYLRLSPGFEAMGFTSFIQGSESNKILARKFEEDTNSVLFALKSFMTGVDFQGDTCRLVIVDKLPFPVPTEPVFAARADQIKRMGKSDFGELTIPMMTLTLEQAYGRLIRTKSDRGVVAILDSRLSSTGYGKKIVNNLPDSPVTTDLAAVKAFYSKEA